MSSKGRTLLSEHDNAITISLTDYNFESLSFVIKKTNHITIGLIS